jgi:hypothetical protein
MKSSDLSLEQLKKLQAAIRPMLFYLRKLRQRMAATSFPESDRLLRDATIAEKILADLVSETETLASYKQRFSDTFG